MNSTLQSSPQGSSAPSETIYQGAQWGVAPMQGSLQFTEPAFNYTPALSQPPPPLAYPQSARQPEPSSASYAPNDRAPPEGYTSPGGQFINFSLEGPRQDGVPLSDRTAAEYQAARVYMAWAYAQQLISNNHPPPDPSGSQPASSSLAANPGVYCPSTIPASASAPYYGQNSVPPALSANTAGAAVASATPAAAAAGTKRGRGRPKGSKNKKQKTTDDRPPERDYVPGVGPRDDTTSSEGAAVLHPTLASKRFTSLVAREGGGGQTGASDVYFFLLGGVESDTPLDEIFAQKPSVKRPADKVYKFLVCRLCYPERWQWANTPHQTNCIRFHLRTHHFTLWRGMVLSLRLKGWDGPVGDHDDLF